LNVARETREFEVGVGMMMIVTQPSILAISGIGSCIGLVMRDGDTMASGLAHIALPNSWKMDDADKTPGKYSDTAVRALVKGLLSTGASLRPIKAKMVGGARVLQNGCFDGSKNIESTRSELQQCGIPIVAEDVGQTCGRSMKFDTATGEVVVRRFQRCSGIAELKDIVVI
jgi:chemotaxis protein CheD